MAGKKTKDKAAPVELSEAETEEVAGGQSSQPGIMERNKVKAGFQEPLVGFQEPLVGLPKGAPGNTLSGNDPGVE